MMAIDKKVEEMIGSLVSRLEPSTDCIVWRSYKKNDSNDDDDANDDVDCLEVLQR